MIKKLYLHTFSKNLAFFIRKHHLHHFEHFNHQTVTTYQQTTTVQQF
jgi:hypothetical protein